MKQITATAIFIHVAPPMCKTPKMQDPIPPKTPSDPTIMLLVRNEEQQETIAAAMTEMTTAMTSMNSSTNL